MFKHYLEHVSQKTWVTQPKPDTVGSLHENKLHNEINEDMKCHVEILYIEKESK